MQNIRSAASGSAASEVKELLDLISKPEKMKDALADLQHAVKEAQAAEKSLKEKEAKLKDGEEKIGALYKEAQAALEKANLKEKEAFDKSQSLGKRESEVAHFEKELRENVYKFEQYKKGIEAEILARESAANAKIEAANDALKKAEDLMKLYKVKSEKLQAALN